MRPNSHKLKCPNKTFIRRITLRKIFCMTQKELSIYDCIIKVKEKSISQVKASDLLNISDRHFRRLVNKALHGALIITLGLQELDYI